MLNRFFRKKYTDEELVSMIRFGDEATRNSALAYVFKDLAFDSEAQKLYRKNGCLPKNGQEDFSQEMFFIFERQVRTGVYDKDKATSNGLKGYFYKICEYSIINLNDPNRSKKQKEDSKNTIHLEDLNTESAADGDKTPLELILQAEQRDRIHAALNKLKPKCKTALLIYYSDGTGQAIKEALGEKVKSPAAKIIFDCREQWKELVENDPQLKEELKAIWES